MTEWLSTGRPYGREHCACPADEGSAAGTHPPRSGDTQAVLLTNVSGNRASSRQPPQLPPQGSGTRPTISSKGATENIITPPPLMFRKREGAQQTLWLSYPHPHQCSVLGTCPALATVTGALCPRPAPRARPTPGVSRTQHSGCRSSLPTSEGTPVRGSQPSDLTQQWAGFGHHFYASTRHCHPPQTIFLCSLGLWLFSVRLHLFPDSNGFSHCRREFSLKFQLW